MNPAGFIGLYSFKKLIIMEYLVFPFGKYKGEKLEDLPSTYIVLALEKFELPEELAIELYRILLGRFKVYTNNLYKLENHTKKELSIHYKNRIDKYENGLKS